MPSSPELHQMQYPLPTVWQRRPHTLETRRKIRFGVTNPRFHHLPLIRPTSDGGVGLVRSGQASGKAEVALRSRLAAHPAIRNLARGRRRPPTYFVAENRLSRISFVPATEPVGVGRIEEALFTDWHRVPAEIAFTSDYYFDEPTTPVAATLDSYETVLRQELDLIRKLRRTGWSMYLAGTAERLLVDENRPVEELSDWDLPEGPIE